MSTFCVLPWIHLASHPHGGVTLCCVSNHDKGINRSRNFRADGSTEWLNLNQHSTDEIMNSDYFRQVRKQMLDNKKPLACMRCYREEENGVVSKRVAENANFSDLTHDIASLETADDGRIATKLRFVELRLGNICNVKCRSCNPASSSKWATEYKQLELKFDFVRSYQGLTGFDWPEKDLFWDDLLENSAHLEVIYINGGEPTLIKKHWEFLERLRASGKAKDVVLWYNINMTNLPESAFEVWKPFKEVRISCSIDDLGDRNALLRYGTKWSDVERNLDRLQKETWINTSVNMTIGWQNLLTVPEYYQYMKHDRGLHVHFNYIYDPEYLSPWILPEHVKALALAKMEPVLADYDFTGIKNQLLNNPSNPDLLRRGIAYNVALDANRSEKSADVFPELYALLKGLND